MRVLFMGTPEFAVPCLNMLVEDGYNVIGVVTQPDKPKGRGRRITSPPVKEYALKKGINVYQPMKLKDEAFNNVLIELNPDIIIVVAYGKILPKYILEAPQYGCINVHASLLPKYRGAGPIQWSIINGEQETGITTMYMAEGLDTGDMIVKKQTLIDANENAGMLHDRLSQLGAETLKETLRQLENGTISRTPQCDEEATYAPMLNKTISQIDWSKTAIEIKNLVRGVNPWPVAYTQYQNELMKVWAVDMSDDSVDTTPGTIIKYVKNEGLYVKAGDERCIIIKEVQFKGARRMSIDAYVAGHSIEIGEILG